MIMTKTDQSLHHHSRSQSGNNFNPPNIKKENMISMNNSYVSHTKVLKSQENTSSVESSGQKPS